jgi:hypothetical protein
MTSSLPSGTAERIGNSHWPALNFGSRLKTRRKHETAGKCIASAAPRSLRDLSIGVCHEKFKFILGFSARCLLGQLKRAMAMNAIYQISKVNINV